MTTRGAGERRVREQGLEAELQVGHLEVGVVADVDPQLDELGQLRRRQPLLDDRQISMATLISCMRSRDAPGAPGGGRMRAPSVGDRAARASATASQLRAAASTTAAT